MRRSYIYIMILALAGMLFSCQKAELSESEPVIKPGDVVTSGEVKVSFSALLPGSPQTKAMGDTPDTDIKSMHLVIFDENGMLVETREATIGSRKDHGDHTYETTFEVTLTVTDQPRIIHFIANCPVDQIAYGHETSIIGNLYVTKGADIETAYWARREVEDLEVQITDVENQIGVFINSNTLSAFQCIPMLRNYAQIVVIDGTTDNAFELLGFTLYNTIGIGTVAPYNNKNQQFQNFLDPSGNKYKYPDLIGLAYPYEGHALAKAELNTELEKNADGTYKFYDPNEEFYMYERKISVKTDEEEKWDESPPHLIIKGTYNGETYYYKADLVYNIIDDKGTEDKTDDIVTDIKYYNILRNFRYQFTIKEVIGKGYSTVEEAVLGSVSNNLSGSATTSKFTNISDTKGRIWVSYTDRTVVSGETVIDLKYKYIPNLKTGSVSNDLVDDGGVITLVNMENGEVIRDYEVSDTDINDGSEWDGFREITLYINEPTNIPVEQAIVIKTDNANLNREVRYTLRQKYSLELECTPKVAAEIGAPVEVDIKLPIGLTEDLFPLDLQIEVYDMSLSPNASMNTMPVESGISVIPVPEKEGKTTFRYIKTIETKADYDALTTVGNKKILKTYWYTNKAENASIVYVINKYFNAAYDDFVNVKYAFTDVTCTPSTIACGLNQSVSISFTMDTDDAGYTDRPVTVTLEGMTDADGNSTLTVTPTSRTVTITGLVTTTAIDDVSFSIDASEYAIGSGYGLRQLNEFNGWFSPTSLGVTAGEEVDYQFSIPAYTSGMTVRVTLNGLEPADDEDALVPVAGEEGVYAFTPASAGDYTLSLQTVNAEEGTCSVTMEAEEYYYLTETTLIEQVGTITINTLNVSFSTGSTNVTEDQTNAMTLSVSAPGEVSYGTIDLTRTSSGWWGPYTFNGTISNLVFAGCDENTEVTFSFTRSNTMYDATATLGDLMDGSVELDFGF